MEKKVCQNSVITVQENAFQIIVCSTLTTRVQGEIT